MVNKQNVLLIILAVILAFAPLALHQEASFGGSDDQAKEVISTVNPDYKPWFNVIWEPPSDEVESFLFALQAAIGAGFIGYFFGYLRGRKASAAAKKNSGATATVTSNFELNG